MITLETLEALVIQEVPSGFFKQLADRQQSLYEEADEFALRNPSWRAPEGEMVIPLVRRALVEHELRLAAANFNLDHLDLRHAGDNCGYGLVRAGKVALSVHHIGGPNHFVRRCKSREQNAAINKSLDQLFLDELFVEPLPKIEEAGIVYAHLLHGVVRERRGDREFTQNFLRLAFPDAELKGYAKNYSVLEMLQKYVALESEPSTIRDIEDNVVPVLNPKKKIQVN